jgi:hypothetical protein
VTRPSPETPGTEPTDELEPGSPALVAALAVVYAVLGAVVLAVVGLEALFPTVGDVLAVAVLVAALGGLLVVLLRQELGRDLPDPRTYSPAPQTPTFRIVPAPPYDWQREERRGTSE